MKANAYLLGSALVAALGGLLFGFDTAVISGTTEALTKVFTLTSGQLGFTVASALIGTIVGALIAGRPADRFGRRPVLLAIAILYFVSALGSAFPWDWASFVFFRFIGGIGVGAASVVSPMYIAEISPAVSRGRLVAITQFNIVLGILLAYLSNYLIAGLDLGAAEWRWMFGVEAVPAAAFFLLLFLTPESPRWLVAQRRTDAARVILGRLATEADNADAELCEIEASLNLGGHKLGENEKGFWSFDGRTSRAAVWVVGGVVNVLALLVETLYLSGHAVNVGVAVTMAVLLGWLVLATQVKRWHDIGVSGWMVLINLLPVVGTLVSVVCLGFIRGSANPNRFGPPEGDPLFSRKYHRPVAAAVAIAAFNQLSGINALIYYTAYIFKMAGAGAQSALLQSVLIGLVNLVFTMAALTVIDRFGRRKLMLVGSVGYIVSLGAAAYSFYTGTGGMLLLASFVVFIAAHAFGQGAVIWVFISEIFPNRVRARGQALGSFTHWIMAAAISWTFPMIAEKSGGHIFTFYMLCCVGQLIWVLRVMPETKGVSLEQIQKRLGIE